MNKKLERLALESKNDRFWYTRASENIKRLSKLHGIPYKTLAGVVAITSQNVKLEQNMKLVYNWIKDGANEEACDGVKHYTIVKNNLKNFLKTGEVRGPKVGEFYKALIGDKSAIVLDTHMGRVFNVDGWSKTSRMSAKKQIRALSKRLNWKPCQVQAAIWCSTYKRSTGFPKAAEYSF